MEQKSYKVIVLTGPEAGKEFLIPYGGCSLGRSSSNEMQIKDEELSRMHCRFTFRDGDLWVTDLASANGTIIDGEPIASRKVASGTKIVLGNTVICVLAEGEALPSEEIDLGLSGNGAPAGGAGAGSKAASHKMLLVVCVMLLALIAAIAFMLRQNAATVQAPAPRAEEAARSLQIRYSKVEGTSENIFQYELALRENGMMSVMIDELLPSRHLVRESNNPLGEIRLAELGQFIEGTGFFALPEMIVGADMPNIYTKYDLTIIWGKRAHHVRVVNKTEPDAFRLARERIETVARNEMALWSIEYPREKLLDMAEDAYSLGIRYWENRGVEIGNLYNSLRQFRICINLLESIEPKPETYELARDARGDAEEELGKRHSEINFDADRAIQMSDWDVAAKSLRELLQLIPDRDDTRYRDAERRLLDVESRMKQ